MVLILQIMLLILANEKKKALFVVLQDVSLYSEVSLLLSNDFSRLFL